MWLFNKRQEIPGVKLTPEDLQVISKAYRDRPEFFRFILSMRDQRRVALDFAPVLKTEADIYAHGLRCHAIQRDIKLLNAIAEMPITAKQKLEKFKTQNESPAPEAEEPWDAPFVPEEKF
jgi:hypothetical protein